MNVEKCYIRNKTLEAAIICYPATTSQTEYAGSMGPLFVRAHQLWVENEANRRRKPAPAQGPGGYRKTLDTFEKHTNSLNPVRGTHKPIKYLEQPENIGRY